MVCIPFYLFEHCCLPWALTSRYLNIFLPFDDRIVQIHSYGKCLHNREEPDLPEDPAWPQPAQRRARYHFPSLHILPPLPFHLNLFLSSFLPSFLLLPVFTVCFLTLNFTKCRKIKILSQYKFSLSFENFEVDDYVSEKVSNLRFFFDFPSSRTLAHCHYTWCYIAIGLRRPHCRQRACVPRMLKHCALYAFTILLYQCQ